MTQITVHQIEDFLKSIKPDSAIFVDIYGYVIRIEERLNGSSHIGKTMKAHPGKDNLENCLRDVKAIVEDMGIEMVKN
jgi:hypothetical protein